MSKLRRQKQLERMHPYIIEFGLHNYGFDSEERVFGDDWWSVEVYRAINNGDLPPQEIPENIDQYIKSYIEDLAKFLRSDTVKKMDFDSIPSGNVHDLVTMITLVRAAKKKLYFLIKKLQQ